MRLEQLVIHGPGDDERVRFGPAVTVFAGLDARARADLIATIVEGLTGRLQNASVIYADHAGQRVFADRNGATYATTGEPAPGPGELLGSDPAVATKLLTVTADGLGLGRQASVKELEDALTAARTKLDQAQAAHNDLVEKTDLVASWRAELTELDRLIEQSDADRARWAWVEKRRQLDELRTELAIRTQVNEGGSDRQILDAVDALRSTGEAWAELSAQASHLREELGPIPTVSTDDLARVAATPDKVPDSYEERSDAWQAARDALNQAEVALPAAAMPPDKPEDSLVTAFAAISQVQLWAAHDELAQATETYDEIVASLNQESIDPEVEATIEAAHLVVVSRQREVDRRFVPGVLSCAALVVGAGFGGYTLRIGLGIFMLVAAAAAAVWLIAIPRRRLTQANTLEQEALSHTDAGSWLGIHLRRLDAATDATDRRRVEVAANARVGGQLDWDETTGGLLLEDLDNRAEAVRAYAEAIDPKAVASRLQQAQATCSAAAVAEAAARQLAGSELEPYGVAESGAADLDPTQLAALLNHRIEAGHLARRAKKLAAFGEREAEAAERLEDLLSHLGFSEGELQARLERAIAAVGWARHRQGMANETRFDADLEHEIAGLVEDLSTTERKDWADVAEPTIAPDDPDVLEARRREIVAQVVAVGHPDVVGAERNSDLAQSDVCGLEAQIAELSSGAGSLQQRLISRLGRATWLGDHEESIPVIMDDPLLSVPVAERLDLLDLLVRLAKHTQVLILTADPVVSRWARDRSVNGPVALYESDAEAEAPISIH